MVAVKGRMKMELLKEGRKQNKGLDPHRPNMEIVNLSPEKQDGLPPAAPCERGMLGKGPRGGTGGQHIRRNDFQCQSSIAGFTLRCAEKHRIKNTLFQKKTV